MEKTTLKLHGRANANVHRTYNFGRFQILITVFWMKSFGYFMNHLQQNKTKLNFNTIKMTSNSKGCLAFTCTTLSKHACRIFGSRLARQNVVPFLLRNLYKIYGFMWNDFESIGAKNITHNNNFLTFHFQCKPH